jgi:DNA-binding XRE family transcriptional regulator
MTIATTPKNNLKLYREKALFKQDEAARSIGMSTRQYQNIEAHTPKSVTYFYRLAGMYGVTIDELLRQSANHNPESEVKQCPSKALRANSRITP